jgi:hypothetical protein
MANLIRKENAANMTLGRLESDLSDLGANVMVVRYHYISSFTTCQHRHRPTGDRRVPSRTF